MATEYYKEKLQQGLEYQDFICERLHHQGIVLQNIQSKKCQLRKENLLGLEIKFDDVMAKTNRIYIETEEKSDPTNDNYVPSGIYRDDECWLFGIGNYDIFFIFDKKMLRRLDANNPSWLFRPQPTSTSKGFCVPVEYAEKIAKVINLEKTLDK